MEGEIAYGWSYGIQCSIRMLQPDSSNKDSIYYPAPMDRAQSDSILYISSYSWTPPLWLGVRTLGINTLGYTYGRICVCVLQLLSARQLLVLEVSV